MRVRGLMKTPVTTVDPDDSLHIADGIMSMGGIRHLPVMRGCAIVGLVADRAWAPGVHSQQARLQAVLGDDATSEVADLAMTVTRGCGTVEVRVSGPGAMLRLFFDPWDLPPADVWRVVNAAVERYRSSFLGRTP